MKVTHSRTGESEGTTRSQVWQTATGSGGALGPGFEKDKRHVHAEPLADGSVPEPVHGCLKVTEIPPGPLSM